MEQATTALQLECANAQCYVNLLKVKGSHKTNVHSLSRLHHDKHRVCVCVCSDVLDLFIVFGILLLVPSQFAKYLVRKTHH